MYDSQVFSKRKSTAWVKIGYFKEERWKMEHTLSKSFFFFFFFFSVTKRNREGLKIKKEKVSMPSFCHSHFKSKQMIKR